MTDNELFAKHAQSYLLCYNDKCRHGNNVSDG